jgi:AraC-like DNA-binding protein
MVVKPIPVMRAVYLNLVLDVLRESGIDYEEDLQRFSLPLRPDARPDAYVPLIPTLSFVHRAAFSSGIEDFGLRAGSRLRISDLAGELHSAILNTATLKDALQVFCRLAEREQSLIRYRIVEEQNNLRICSTLNVTRYPGVDQCGEWLRIMPLITLIRHFAGPAWTPATIAFRSQCAPGQYAQRLFSPGTCLLTGQQETGIVFPASLFRLAIVRNCSQAGAVVTPNHKSAAPGQAVWDFPTSLQKLLQTYLDDGYPDVKLAARITGSSVRTLQRRLGQFDLSYKDVVQQARFETAMHLLRDPDTKVIDAAYAAGYDDPSHFTRAFKILAGVSPRQYRAGNHTY